MPTPAISLQEYKSQSFLQTVCKVASETTKDFDGFYKVANVFITVLTYPALSGNEDYAPLREKFNTVKEVNNSVLIVSQINEAVVKRNEREELFDKIKRGFLTCGAICKTLRFGYSAKLYKWKNVFTYSVGKVPLFGAITDIFFLGAFSLGAVKSIGKLSSQVPTYFKKTKNNFEEWKKLHRIQVYGNDGAVLETETTEKKKERYDAYRQDKLDRLKGKKDGYLKRHQEKQEEIEALRSDIQSWIQEAAADASKGEQLNKKINSVNKRIEDIGKKRTPLAEKVAKYEEKITQFLTKIDGEQKKDINTLLTRKVTKWEVRAINSKKEMQKSGLGFVSDFGKVVCITTSLVAMQIFGWAGLAALLTITTVALVADLCGLFKFIAGVQMIDEEKSITQALNAI